MDARIIKRYLTMPEDGNINLWLSINDVQKIHDIMSQCNKEDLIFQIKQVEPLQYELTDDVGNYEVKLNGNNLFYFKQDLQINGIDADTKTRVELIKKDNIWEQFF